MSPATNDSSDFDLQRIQSCTFVESIEFQREVPSTSDRALTLATDEDLCTPLLVLTDHQTAGRGRRNHRWWSKSGAITCSLLLDPDAISISLERLSVVSLIVGLAVCKVLEQLLPSADIRLKWPNDVLLNSRKVCGILTEVSPRPLQRVILGIGLNVNNRLKDGPVDVVDRATSLRDAVDEEFDLTEVLISVLISVERELNSKSAAQDLPNCWQRYCVLQGRTVSVESGIKSVTGVCLAIDDYGALLLETPHGVQQIFSGTVTNVQ